MIRRIPIVPTLLVLAAAVLMIRLGFWQISRLHQKETLLARYAAAETDTSQVSWPRDPAAATLSLYRRARIDCVAVLSQAAAAGRSASDEFGIGHIAQCRLADGAVARVVLGWSPDPAPRDWRGGPVTGILAPGPRLVADPPVAGLKASERPDPRDLPNNHLSYAVQWFLFAATALVIYPLALRRRWRDAG